MPRSNDDIPVRLSHEEKNQLYAGAPLKKSVGDYVVSQGVSVFQLYGR